MFIRPHPLRPLKLPRPSARSAGASSSHGKGPSKGQSADAAPYLLGAAQQNESSGLAQLIQRFFFEQVDSLATVTAAITAKGSCPDEQKVYGAFAQQLAGSVSLAGAAAAEPEPLDDSGRWYVTMTSSQGTTVALTWQSSAPAGADLSSCHKAIGQLVAAVNLRLGDIAKLRQLGRLAFVDPLTGLGNSRQLKQCVEDQINRANRFGGGFTVLFVDLDKFKAVNDTYGHAEGDRVLQRIAAALSSAVRSVDQVFRLAGDEFVIVLAGAGARTSEAVVSRLKQALRADSQNPTCSVGIASYPKDGQTYNELLKVADHGMYLSKDHKDTACGRHGDRDPHRG